MSDHSETINEQDAYIAELEAEVEFWKGQSQERQETIEILKETNDSLKETATKAVGKQLELEQALMEAMAYIKAAEGLDTIEVIKAELEAVESGEFPAAIKGD